VQLVRPHPPRSDEPTDAEALEALIKEARRRARRRRVLYGAIGLVAASAALFGYFGFDRGGGVTPPVNEPPPTPTPAGIFANVGGWIAFQNDYLKRPFSHYSIWAADPTRPNGPNARIQLSDRPGEPLNWSSDGSKLLIWRRREGPTGTPRCPRCAGPDWTGLFVLNADGTETRLVVHRPGARYISPGGSFSPDGSEVVFATHRGGIYAVDADGGTPRILAEGGADPTFSPDGTKIAYFEFRDKPGHTLRVMNADGTGDRVLLGSQAVDCYYPSSVRPAWSPDGTHIAFSCDDHGIRVVGADGSGLRTVIPNEDALGPLWDLGFGIPYWSPDGSRIAFEVMWTRDVPPTHRGPGTIPRLAIANADGTHVQVFEYPSVAGPWNPLPLAVPGEGNPTATTGSGIAAPWVYAIALVVVVGVLVGGRRARGKLAARS
jgi:hypothetical protein